MQTEVKRNRLAAEVRSLGRRALPLQFDITKKSQVEEVVRRTVAEFGRIDVLLNCSALTYESDFLNFTEEAFNQCIDRGPKAYFLACQAVGRQMAEQRSGKIINLSTTDARIGIRRIDREQRGLFQHRVDDPRHRSGAGILWRQRELARLRTDG